MFLKAKCDVARSCFLNRLYKASRCLPGRMQTQTRSRRVCFGLPCTDHFFLACSLIWHLECSFLRRVDVCLLTYFRWRALAARSEDCRCPRVVRFSLNYFARARFCVWPLLVPASKMRLFKVLFPQSTLVGLSLLARKIAETHAAYIFSSGCLARSIFFLACSLIWYLECSFLRRVDARSLTHFR